MKKKVLSVVTVLSLIFLMTGCTKERTCRCAVRNSSVVRIIEIDKGKCENIKFFRHRDEIDSLFLDSLLCTDYTFDIDSIYNTEEL